MRSGVLTVTIDSTASTELLVERVSIHMVTSSSATVTWGAPQANTNTLYVSFQDVYTNLGYELQISYIYHAHRAIISVFHLEVSSENMGPCHPKKPHLNLPSSFHKQSTLSSSQHSHRTDMVLECHTDLQPVIADYLFVLIQKRLCFLLLPYNYHGNLIQANI